MSEINTQQEMWLNILRQIPRTPKTKYQQRALIKAIEESGPITEKLRSALSELNIKI